MPLLQAIAELPEAALHGSLARLQAAEFLYETRLFPDLVYTFKHALTLAAAYGSLLYERRRALHQRTRSRRGEHDESETVLFFFEAVFDGDAGHGGGGR